MYSIRGKRSARFDAAGITDPANPFPLTSKTSRYCNPVAVSGGIVPVNDADPAISKRSNSVRRVRSVAGIVPVKPGKRLRPKFFSRVKPPNPVGIVPVMHAEWDKSNVLRRRDDDDNDDDAPLVMVSKEGIVPDNPV